jgi:hypothetical protein
MPGATVERVIVVDPTTGALLAARDRGRPAHR